MSVENLGEPLTGVYSIPGGQARLYEPGVTVNGVIVSFAFPMIGRPSIVTGTSASASPFEPDAINFRLGNSQLEQIVPMILNALAGRLSLVPTRQVSGRVPLTIGSAAVVTPAPGVGGIRSRLRPCRNGNCTTWRSSPTVVSGGSSRRTLFIIAGAGVIITNPEKLTGFVNAMVKMTHVPNYHPYNVLLTATSGSEVVTVGVARKPSIFTPA